MPCPLDRLVDASFSYFSGLGWSIQSSRDNDGRAVLVRWFSIAVANYRKFFFVDFATLMKECRVRSTSADWIHADRIYFAGSGFDHYSLKNILLN